MMVRAFSTRGPVTKKSAILVDCSWTMSSVLLMLYIIFLCISFGIIYIIQLGKEYQ